MSLPCHPRWRAYALLAPICFAPSLFAATLETATLELVSGSPENCPAPWRDRGALEIASGDAAQFVLVDGAAPGARDTIEIAIGFFGTMNASVASGSACRLSFRARDRVSTSPESLQRWRELAAASRALELAETARRANRSEELREAAREACVARERLLGETHAWTEHCQLQVMRLFGRSNTNAEQQAALAARVANQFEAMFQSSPGPALEARQLEAVTLLRLRRWQDAYQSAERAWAGRKVHFGADHPDTLESRLTLGNAAFRAGDLEKCAESYSEVIRAYEKSRGAADGETLRIKMALAPVLARQGRGVETEALYREVHAARAAEHGEGDTMALTALRGVAEARLARGRPAEALEIVEQAMPMVLKDGANRGSLPRRYRELLARLYWQFGLLEQAESLIARVVEEWIAAEGVDSQNALHYRINHGLILVSMGRSAEAAAMLGKALDDDARAGTSDENLALNARHGLGEALRDLGRDAEAMDAMSRAAQVARRTLPEPDPYRAKLELSLASARARLGDNNQAIADMERVLAVADASYGSDHVFAAVPRATLALLLSERNPPRAELLLEQMVAIVEAERARGTLAVEMRQGLLARATESDAVNAGYKTLVRLKAARGDIDGALALSEKVKGRTLTEGLALRRVLGAKGVPAADLDDLRAAIDEVAGLEYKAALATPGSQERAVITARRLEAQRALDARSAAIEARHGVLEDRKPPSTPAAIARAIGANAVFVSYVVDGDRVLAISVDRARGSRARDLGRVPGLRKTIDAYRRWLTSERPETEPIWRLQDGSFRWELVRPAPDATRVASSDRLAEALAKTLIAPLADWLGDRETWLISPDASLASLAFDTLPWSGRRVAERKSVSYVASATVMMTALELPFRPRPSSVLAIAASQPTGGGLPGEASGSKAAWGALPLAESEVLQLVAHYPAANRAVLLGADASKATLESFSRSGRLGEFDIVHFAAHGYLSPRSAQLSAVVLASAPGAPEGEGYLTAVELGRLRLRSSVVVVSSCDSGSGEFVSGEGIVGLPYAFMLAGARATVLALWPVSDAASAEIMPRFHARLRAGASPATALAETKREFMKHPKWSAPRYWAPFVLYGAP